MLTRLVSIDRRWVFLAIGLAVSIPLVVGKPLPPGTVNPRTRAVYDMIQRAKPGGVIVLAYDYGPSSMPEVHPMALALTRHALKRGLRVLAVALGVQGSMLADDIFNSIGKEMPEKKDGTDYVNLGFAPGGFLVILGMGESITKIFTTDARDRRTTSLPVMRGVDDYDGIYLLVDLASGDSPFTWVLYAGERFGQKLAVGATAVMATDIYPYLDAGQFVGHLNGLKGAAEYEQLIGQPDDASLGMTSQTVAHLVIILFVALGNIGYFATRRRR